MLRTIKIKIRQRGVITGTNAKRNYGHPNYFTKRVDYCQSTIVKEHLAKIGKWNKTWFSRYINSIVWNISN